MTNGSEAPALDFLRSNNSCSATQACAPKNGINFTCVLNRCVADLGDLIKSFENDSTIRPDLERLDKCLSDKAIKPFAHLGREDTPLCIWTAPTNPRQVCEGRGPERPCPVFAVNGSCDSVLQKPDNTVAVKVDTALELIDTKNLPNDPFTQSGGISVCDAIRAKRKGQPILDRAEESKKIQDADRFNEDQARGLASRIGFVARYGGYGAITVDGVPLYSTGSPWAGPAGGQTWPCHAVTRKGCPGAGLFCDVGNCSAVDQRARLNNRMLGAVMGLRAATLPSHPDTSAGGLAFAGTISYPMILPQAICGSSCVVPNPGDGSQRTLSLGTSITERSGSPFGLVYEVPTNASSDVRLAYAVPTSTGGLFTLDTNSLPGGIAIPSRYVGVDHVAFDEVKLYLDEGSPPPTYSILRPDSFWSCMHRGPNCGQLDPVVNGGCPPPKKVCDDTITVVVNGKEIEKPLCRNVDVPCNRGFFNAALSSSSPNGPVPLNVKARLFGAIANESGDLGDPKVDPDSTAPFNVRFDKNTLLDGLELLCEVAEAGASPTKPNPLTACGFSPVINTVDDLSKVPSFMQCTANEIMKGAGRVVLSNFPTAAMDPLRKESSTGAFPAIGGEVGVNVSELRSALLDLANVPILVSGEINTMGSHIEAVRLAAQAKQIHEKIAGVQLSSQFWERMTQCAVASSPSFSIGGSFGITGPSLSIGISFNPGAAAATCANSFAQTSFADELNALTSNLDDITVKNAFNQFSEQFSDSATRMNGYGVRMTSAVETVDRQIALVEVQRQKAKRALARALYVDSFQSKFQATINAALWKRFLIDAQRYKEALTAAQRMAFLAKRAIEMRLGIKLSELTEDLPLVPAPALWESGVCTSTGVDLQKMASEQTSVPGGPVLGSAIDFNSFQFEDPFIGDYVRKLERLVESYQLVNAFHEGADTAVISLRDDVQNVRAECDAPVNNLLFHAGQLDQPPSDKASGWQRTGCQTTTPGGQELVANCLGTFEEEAPPLFSGIPALTAGAKAYRLHFSADQPALVQRVEVGPGVYRASVYMHDPATTPTAITDFDPASPSLTDPTLFNNDKGMVLRVVGGGSSADAGADASTSDASADPTGGGGVTTVQAGTVIADCRVNSDCTLGATCTGNLCLVATSTGDAGTSIPTPVVGSNWPRLYKIITVLKPVTLEFGFTRPSVTRNGVRQPLSDLIIAGPMLEQLGAVATNGGTEPGVFTNTTDVITRRMPVCQDTSGKVFRHDAWRQDSARLCSDGFTGDCNGEDAKEFDFWETTFSVSQKDIEAGRIFNQAGFARGNFNYRIESIAVNFVGTGIHDCATSPLPSTCFASGFVPYTLVHDGPYSIRNHQGKDFVLDLFPGRIENARGLATERYVTNPISSADHQLIDQYLRKEFQGRPLDGNFVLRVWNTPGLVFDAIQDVQLVVNYRYWTRFQ